MALKRTWFHILTVLAQDVRHGADIQRQVAEQTANDVKLYPVTLYSALEDLEELGWIREAPSPVQGHKERRRYYRLTPAGRTALSREAGRLEHAAAAARAALTGRQA